MIKILLVDHANESGSSVRKLLWQSNSNEFQINCVSGYRAILDGFRSQSADICVIDSVAGNELRLLAQARSMGSSLPIVVVIDNSAEEAMAAMRNGAADCLIREGLTAAKIAAAICCALEQARYAKAQQQLQSRYRALFDNTEDIIFTQDLVGNITTMNPAGLRWLGYSEAEILKTKADAIIDPAFQPLMATMVEVVLDAQIRTNHKVQMAARSGNALLVDLNAHPIYRQGKPVEIQVLARPLNDARNENAFVNVAKDFNIMAFLPPSYRVQHEI